MAFPGPVPIPPNSGDPIPFNARADAFLGWMALFAQWLEEEGYPNFANGIRSINGTAAAPAWSFSGDTDTGIFRPAADALAFATGGVERLRITSAGLLNSSTAIIQAQSDVSAGRLLTPGWLGWGGAPLTPPANIDITDNSMPNGALYLISNATVTAGLPSGLGATFNGQMLHLRRAGGGGETRLLFIDYSSIGSGIWTQSRLTSGWTAWRRVVDAGNILGTVSLSGGVPTGAIIERGSNANGEYTKFADGTLICWHSVIIGAGGVETWTFPHAFSAQPAISSVPAGFDATSTSTIKTRTNTSVGIYFFSSSGSPSPGGVSASATGRWN